MKCPLCRTSGPYPFKSVSGRDYFRCTVCAMVHLDPSQRLLPAEEKARYDLHENDPSDQKYREFLSQLTTPLKKYIHRGDLGLDFGCGPGPTVSVMLREAGYGVVDYDPLYFPDEAALKKRYDFISCTEVIEHFYEPARMFPKLKALLKPQGVLGIMTGVLEDEELFEGWHYHREPSHVCFYAPQTLEWIAQAYDFRLLHTAKNITIFGVSH